MSAGESRRVLEVWSAEGRVLEGVFETREREAADHYVANLGEGCGVRAKVLGLPICGIVTRPAQVAKAWKDTPFPPKWYVLVREGSELALGVWGEGQRDAALATTEEMERKARLEAVGQGPQWMHYELRVWLHPRQPMLGENYRERKAAR